MKILKSLSIAFAALLVSCGNATQQTTEHTQQTTEQNAAPAPSAAVGVEKNFSTIETEGTNFRDLSFEQAIDSAKAEGKLVFVNMHTKTCRPCRLMEKTVFPKEKLGKYLNEHFVSIILDAEEGQGAEIKARYQVEIYPTYLVIDTAATKLGAILGAEKDIDKFIEKIENIINPSDSTAQE